ncbi:NADH-quinone oxidoreductase subunit A [Thermostilla marina]
MTPTLIVGYVTLFILVATAVVLGALVLGRFLRPHAPSEEKQATYECGEPSIGSPYVQFDLRFYVVALLFLIFDVEVAFFFPWAVVFGKANQLADPRLEPAAVVQKVEELGLDAASVAEISKPEAVTSDIPVAARRLARTAMVDIAVFFAVLMVGFAYVWYRGDLNWVRALPEEAEPVSPAASAKAETTASPSG